MSKLNVNKELSELISRFRELKKAIAEENKYTPIQRAAIEVANKMNAPMKKTKVDVEQEKSQQLANQLQKSGILGNRPVPQQPSAAEQQAWLRGNGFTTEAMAKAEDAAWGNSINSWLTEATKPVNARFNSPQEEQAYWDSIKVNGGGGEGGY